MHSRTQLLRTTALIKQHSSGRLSPRQQSRSCRPSRRRRAPRSLHAGGRLGRRHSGSGHQPQRTLSGAGGERARSGRGGGGSGPEAGSGSGGAGAHLVRVQVGVGLAEAEEEGLRVPAQRLSSGQEAGAPHVQPDPFAGPRAGQRRRATPTAGPARAEAASRGHRELTVVLRRHPHHRRKGPPRLPGPRRTAHRKRRLEQRPAPSRPPPQRLRLGAPGAALTSATGPPPGRRPRARLCPMPPAPRRKEEAEAAQNPTCLYYRLPSISEIRHPVTNYTSTAQRSVERRINRH